MEIKGAWHIEIIDRSYDADAMTTVESKRSYPIPEYDGETSVIAFMEDWVTDDIGVSAYAEVRFVFIPDPKNWDENGDLRERDERMKLIESE